MELDIGECNRHWRSRWEKGKLTLPASGLPSTSFLPLLFWLLPPLPFARLCRGYKRAPPLEGSRRQEANRLTEMKATRWKASYVKKRRRSRRQRRARRDYDIVETAAELRATLRWYSLPSLGRPATISSYSEASDLLVDLYQWIYTEMV